MSEHSEMPMLWWSPTGGLIRGGTNGGYDDARRLVLAPADEDDLTGPLCRDPECGCVERCAVIGDRLAPEPGDTS